MSTRFQKASRYRSSRQNASTTAIFRKFKSKKKMLTFERLRPHSEDELARNPGLEFSAIDDTSADIVWSNNTGSNNPAGDEDPRSQIKIWVSTTDEKPEEPSHILTPDQVIDLGGTGEKFNLSGLDQGMSTYTWVQFQNVYGASDIMSGFFETTNTPATAPTPPDTRTTSNITTTSATLNWTDESNNEDGFKVYISTKLVVDPTRLVPVLKSPGTTSHTFSNLTPSITYYWWVSAYNSVGENYIVSAITFKTGTTLTNLVPTYLQLKNPLTTSEVIATVELVTNPAAKVRVPIRGEQIEIGGEIIVVDKASKLAPDIWGLDITRSTPTGTTIAASTLISLSVPTPNVDTGFIFGELSVRGGVLLDITGGRGILPGQSEFLIFYNRLKPRLRLQSGDQIVIESETMRIFSIVEQVANARIVVDRLNPETHVTSKTTPSYIIYRDSSQ